MKFIYPSPKPEALFVTRELSLGIFSRVRVKIAVLEIEKREKREARCYSKAKSHQTRYPDARAAPTLLGVKTTPVVYEFSAKRSGVRVRGRVGCPESGWVVVEPDRETNGWWMVDGELRGEPKLSEPEHSARPRHRDRERHTPAAPDTTNQPLLGARPAQSTQRYDPCRTIIRGPRRSTSIRHGCNLLGFYFTWKHVAAEIELVNARKNSLVILVTGKLDYRPWIFGTELGKAPSSAP
ncbi:hypothetical protein KQX54_003138 [Cotesia glomerata]|uniref:Uncharacterized protein n=1 Tax=Cotesia glomerata TaxID=32391 RepID=A0AAV7IKH7_COTGL|nr:hypothetical protein KQX54_003138 [Cotesia glomerata]